MSKATFVFYGVVHSKKNSKRIIYNRRTGKPQIISSAQAIEMERAIATQLSEQNAVKALKTPFDGKCEVHIKLYQPDKRRRDLDNQATSLLDGLVDAGILLDDHCKIVTKLTVELAGYDKANPRAEIEVEYGTLL